MKIDPYCQQQNCSLLNLLFSDVQISLILLDVSPWGLYNRNKVGDLYVGLYAIISRKRWVIFIWSGLLL